MRVDPLKKVLLRVSALLRVLKKVLFRVSALLRVLKKSALRSKSLRRVLKRVRYSIKCSGEWVNQMSEPLKRVRYS